jgi:hypothetical protein
LKVKVKQNFYYHEKERLVNVGEEIEVKDAHAKDLINANYVEEVVVKQPKVVKASKKVGEE